MRILDLCDQWIKHVVGAGDRVSYESTYPALFEHYYRFWAVRREDVTWPTQQQVIARRSLVCDRLRRIEDRFAALGHNLTNLEVVLFVGQGSTNGHAFCDHGVFVVWIPVEAYATSFSADVFLAHEIVHALHYTATPAWYFDNVRERHLVARVLITEGVATYLSQKLMGISEEEALWADFLSGDDRLRWMDQCQHRMAELCVELNRNFDASIPDSGLFCLRDLGDVSQSRGGYLVGSRMIRTIAERGGSSKQDLLQLDRPSMERAIRGLLYELAH